MCLTLGLLSSQNPQKSTQDNRILGFRAEGSEYVSVGRSVAGVEAVESEAKQRAPNTAACSYTKTGREPGSHLPLVRCPFWIPWQWELSGTIQKDKKHHAYSPKVKPIEALEIDWLYSEAQWSEPTIQCAT